ncbi:hypothetical protein ACWEO2_17060 [Nocardia sp. NPDC004278]
MGAPPAVGDAPDLLHIDVHHVPGPLGDNHLRCAVRVTVGIDEPSPVEAELGEDPGDGTTAYGGAGFVEFERYSRGGPLLVPPHRLIRWTTSGLVAVG